MNLKISKNKLKGGTKLSVGETLQLEDKELRIWVWNNSEEKKHLRVDK